MVTLTSEKLLGSLSTRSKVNKVIAMAPRPSPPPEYMQFGIHKQNIKQSWPKMPEFCVHLSGRPANLHAGREDSRADKAPRVRVLGRHGAFP